MANLIQIKRSTVTANPTSLANGELAFSANGDVLFVGSNSAVVPIAGKRTPGVLTANQALVANSSSAIFATEVPFRIYSPADGVSRQPIMFIKVDLPDPEGPIRATYSFL